MSMIFLLILERAKGFEPSTPTLARISEVIPGVSRSIPETYYLIDFTFKAILRTTRTFHHRGTHVVPGFVG
jgi:hypothetical protein